MFKKKYLGLAIAGSLLVTSAFAELETSIVLKNETATMVKDGIRTGEATTDTDTQGSGKGVYKFENTAQVFLNDDLGNGTSWHGELKLTRDNKAIDGYKGHMNMSQQDYLRELYLDTKISDWDVRLGKQQVVWGTADGIKLLDMMNPTDWREFNQNTMAESRIPTWMINAEKYLDNGGNIQVIAGLAEKNVIAGLNSSGDQGAPFVMKGVDSITGKVNGFLNVTPALAGVATSFDLMAQYGGFATTSGSFSSSLAPFAGVTVDGFAGNAANEITGGYWVAYDYQTSGAVKSLGTMLSSQQQFSYTSGQLSTLFGITTPTNYYSVTSAAGGSSAGDIYTYKYDGNTYSYASATSGSALLYGTAENGTVLNSYATANNGATNLVDSSWDLTIPDAAFEYMPMATFATFNTFAGMTTKYIVDDAKKGNLGFRFKDTTSSGLNYSLNYAYRADSNPYIDTYYRDRSSGNRLTTEYIVSGAFATGLPVYASGGTGTLASTPITAAQLPTAIMSFTSNAAATKYGEDMRFYKAGQAYNAVTVLVRDSEGHYYGSREWNGINQANSYNDIEMVFEEKQNRVHNIGGSFDYAFDFETPVVLRGEALYTKGEMKPVINKHVLATGDLAGALSMQESDTFKYVVGADVTVLTDMMLSGQFIQFRDLDYVDNKKTCTTQMGSSIDCSTYTADMATLGMGNQMKQAEENKEFYSLFLSKPFGDSGEGRWNNIFIYEEGGGKWNRFDVEYGFNNQLIGTLEYNKYFGDNDTMFGQFENASIVQIGLKYLLQ